MTPLRLSRFQTANLSARKMLTVLLLVTSILVPLGAGQTKGAASGDEQPADKARQYFPVTIEKLSQGKNFHTHIRVIGRVALIKKEADGDTHIRLEDSAGHFIVAECIPVLPCPVKPKVGDTIQVKGIYRQDGEHKWFEIHPIESLKIIQGGCRDNENFDCS